MGCIVLGSVNGDASSVSGCSVLPVSESKAVCVLTAMDLKLTEVVYLGACCLGLGIRLRFWF